MSNSNRSRFICKHSSSVFRNALYGTRTSGTVSTPGADFRCRQSNRFTRLNRTSRKIDATTKFSNRYPPNRNSTLSITARAYLLARRTLAKRSRAEISKTVRPKVASVESAVCRSYHFVVGRTRKRKILTFSGRYRENRRTKIDRRK